MAVDPVPGQRVRVKRVRPDNLIAFGGSQNFIYQHIVRGFVIYRKFFPPAFINVEIQVQIRIDIPGKHRVHFCLVQTVKGCPDVIVSGIIACIISRSAPLKNQKSNRSRHSKKRQFAHPSCFGHSLLFFPEKKGKQNDCRRHKKNRQHTSHVSKHPKIGKYALDKNNHRQRSCHDKRIHCKKAKGRIFSRLF